jgi:WD40 repeat protein
MSDLSHDMQPKPDREDALFEAALRLTRAERVGFLKGVCHEDPTLLQRLEFRLVAHDETAGGGSSESGSEFVATVLSEPTPGEEAGLLIGRYKLLEKLGEGGFGTVWLAEQKEPVRRKVALKIIKLGMDTKQVVARFEAERQALAMMDHPNIAKVLDAGTTDTGRPYFVMELVRGVPLTQFCDEQQMATRNRLELFVKVCQAVQHAHQKGIIHRDLKPSNILVTLHDEVAVPKVIDFGIAKATQQDLTEKTIHTQFQQFIGTPAYMSPEQAEMSGLDVDTRSDIYSLGVLLYELLVGRTPFDTKDLIASGIDEMRKAIREKEPVRPSTKLATLHGEELTTTAKRRSADRSKLLHQLKGDLDWIVMKCLEKDRARRYETANGLAMDLLRHLNNEPVVARPPSAAYRFQKAFRRNKLLYTAGMAVALALLAGISMSLWEAARATQAKLAAEAAQKQAQLSEHKAREAEAGQARLRAEAETRALMERRRAYAADMNLAQQAISLNNFGRAQELLNRHRPATKSEIDLRGWEWRYLWQICQGDDLFTLCHRTNTIWSLASSGDGRWLAAGEYYPGGISIWDLRSRQEISGLATGFGLVTTAFSPRGSLLAFATQPSRTNIFSTQNEVRVLDLVTRRTVATLPVGSECHGLAFSDDGTRLVSITDGPLSQVTLWHLPDGQKLAAFSAAVPEFDSHPSFTPDLRLAAYTTSKSRLRVVDLATGTELWSAKAAEDEVISQAFSPDGKILASTAGYVEGAVRLWNVASGQEIGRLEGHRAWVSAPVFWPDGKTLATASADQTIRLWDISDPSKGRPLAVLRGQNCEIWSLRLLSDNVTLVSGGKDGSIRFWDTTKFRGDQTFTTLPQRVLDWGFAPDSKSLIAVHPGGDVSRWKGNSFQEIERVIQAEPKLMVRNELSTGCISPDCRRCATGYTNGTVRVWDFEHGTLLRELRVRDASTIQSIDLFTRTERLIVRLPDNSMHEWDWPGGREVGSWACPQESRAHAVSPDERWHVSFGLGGAAVLRDRTAGTQTNLNVQLAQVSQVAFSPNGKLLAAGSWLGFVKVWSTDAWQETATLHGFLLGIDSVTFSADSSRLAVGSGGGKEALKIWDVASFQELLTLEAEGSTYYQTAFSPDGDLLGSRNGAGVLHLWRAPSWEEISAAESRSEGKRF